MHAIGGLPATSNASKFYFGLMVLATNINLPTTSSWLFRSNS